MIILKVKKILKFLGVEYSDEKNVFLVKEDENGDIINEIPFDDFPYVFIYEEFVNNYEKHYLAIKFVDTNDLEEQLEEIIKYINKKKEEIESSKKKLIEFEKKYVN